jgi:hypothetical protein
MRYIFYSVFLNVFIQHLIPINFKELFCPLRNCPPPSMAAGGGFMPVSGFYLGHNGVEYRAPGAVCVYAVFDADGEIGGLSVVGEVKVDDVLFSFGGEYDGQVFGYRGDFG